VEELFELIEVAKRRLATTDDYYKRERLDDGIRLAEELLQVIVQLSKLGERKAGIHEAILPMANRQFEMIVLEWEQGGLFEENNGGREDISGDRPED